MHLSQCTECISHTGNFSVSNEDIRDPKMKCRLWPMILTVG